jgi:hypothetical protein
VNRRANAADAPGWAGATTVTPEEISMQNQFIRHFKALLLLPLLGVFAACDNPVRDDDHDDPDAAGLRFRYSSECAPR